MLRIDARICSFPRRFVTWRPLARGTMNPEISPALMARMLAQTDWVRALVRSLGADEATADDALQDAWVVTLRRPPAEDSSETNLRAWLAQVVRRFGVSQQRSERRRAHREQRAARSEYLPSTAAVVEREELRRRIVEAVLALEDPYRSTLLLHFFEGASAAQIARKHDVPASTVRNRVRRGLDALRLRFERERGTEWRTWATAILPIAGTPTAAKSVIGGVIVWTKSNLTVAVACIAALSYVTWRTLAAPDSRAPASGAPAQVALASNDGASSARADSEQLVGEDLRTGAPRHEASGDAPAGDPPVEETPKVAHAAPPISADFLSAAEELAGSVFRGPIDQQKAVDLLGDALKTLEDGEREQLDDGSWKFTLPSSDPRASVTLLAIPSVRGGGDIKLEIRRPDAAFFPGNTADVRQSQTDVVLSARGERAPVLNVTTRVDLTFDPMIWTAHNGIGPFRLGGGTRIDASGSVWRETTGEAVESNGEASWKITHGARVDSPNALQDAQFQELWSSLSSNFHK